MDRSSPEYTSDEPLDLSCKPPVVKATKEKRVQQDGPLCLVKSCSCHSKIMHKVVAVSDPPLPVYDNRMYSSFTSKSHHIADNARSGDNYEVAALQSNTSYQRNSPSYSSYVKNNRPNVSFDNHSPHALLVRNHSMAYSLGNGDKPIGRYNVDFPSQSVRSSTPQVTSLIDYVNESIELGLKSDTMDVGASKRIKLNDGCMNESRGSPSDPKIQRLEDHSAPLRKVDDHEKSENEEKIDVMTLDVSNSPDPQNEPPLLYKTTGATKRENSPTNNELTTEPTDQNSSDGHRKKSRSKILALDYLISKVLVERLDIPYVGLPKTHAIKRIFTGDGNKGQLRLIDLIELQVEESLKV